LQLKQNGIILVLLKITKLKHKQHFFKTASTYHGHLAVFTKAFPILEQRTMSCQQWL